MAGCLTEKEVERERERERAKAVQHVGKIANELENRKFDVVSLKLYVRGNCH